MYESAQMEFLHWELLVCQLVNNRTTGFGIVIT